MIDAISLDIETLSLKTNALVLQVGFCLINLDTGCRSMPVRLNVGRSQQEQRHQDPDTIAWWNNQDPDIRIAVLYPAASSMVSIQSVHFELSKVCQPHRTVWANSPSFDCVILRSLFEDCGLEAPWNFRDERCLRTMAKFVDPEGNRKPPKNQNAHDALCDAEWQADYLYNLTKAMT